LEGAAGHGIEKCAKRTEFDRHPFEEAGHGGAMIVSTEVEDYSEGTRHLGEYRMCLVNMQGKSLQAVSSARRLMSGEANLSRFVA
jgi:hypothetical protein